LDVGKKKALPRKKLRWKVERRIIFKNNPRANSRPDLRKECHALTVWETKPGDVKKMGLQNVNPSKAQRPGSAVPFRNTKMKPKLVGNFQEGLRA